MQVALTEEVVGILEQKVGLMEKKYDTGQVDMQDVYLVRGDLASAQNAMETARSGQQKARRALEILLGRYPAGEIETAPDLVPVPPPIPVGRPSDLLERRPDVVAADRRVAAAFNMSEQARLAKLPRFSLNLGAGVSSALILFAANAGGYASHCRFGASRLQAVRASDPTSVNCLFRCNAFRKSRILPRVRASLTAGFRHWG